MTRTEIRPMHSDDTEPLAAALVEVHQLDGYPVEGVDNPKAWLAVENPIATWTATLDSTPVGYVALTSPGPADDAARLLTEQQGTTPDRIAVLGRLFVSPQARGHSLGRRLTQTAMKHAQAQGLRAVLDVMTKDQEAIRLYESLGWTLLGTLKHRYGPSLTEPARAYLSPSGCQSTSTR